MATSIESQVAAAYKAAVGLDIPASNLAARVAEIQSGASSVASYTNAINSSTKAQVSQAYQQATGSVPSQSALDSAVAQVKSGTTTVGNIASQAQAQAQSKASTERDVAAAYKEATGIDMPADKLAQRVADITSGVTTLDAYKTALNSSTRAQIAQAYKAAVGADMPAEKLEQRVAEINSGKTTLDEYKASVSASPRSQISKAYYSLTGELPSDTLLESYVKQVKDGVQTVDDIQKYFGLIGTVAVTYKQAIGSDMPAEKLIQRVEDIQNGLTTLGDYKSALEASTRALVAKAYKSAIGLDIPAEKLEQRVSEIKSGQTTLDSYVTSLNSSPRAIISKEYQAATGSIPTSELLESYVAKVNAGAPFETIKTEIANIPEAQDRAYNLAAKDNLPKFYRQDYVVGDFGYSLKTNPDGSPVMVLDNNAISQDYHGYINDVYQRLLGRPISDSEFAAFDRDKWFYTKTDDQAGSLSNAVLIERSVLNSPEFQNKSSNRSVWVTDGRTGNPVLIPSEIAKLPKVGDFISNGGMVDFTPQTKMLAENVYPEAYVEGYNSEGYPTKTLDTNKLLSAIAADPTRYMNSLFATVSGGIKREQMIGQAGFANSGVSNDSLKTLATSAQDYFNYLTKSGSTLADLQKIYTDAQTSIEKTTSQSIADQKDTGSGWIDEMGDFLEKYEVTIMLAVAAPVMGAGLAAVAAGGVAAAGATAAVGSAAAAAATAAGVGFAGMSGTLLASAITASIMGVANTGMALGNGASWEQALKTGVFSSAASFTGAQLGSQIGGALTEKLISEGVAKAAATQIASTVSNTLSTSLSSGVAAAINGKDISDAMLISGIGAAIGSSLAGATGSTQVGNIAGGTAAGVVAGKDFGSAMQDSIISGAISLVNGLIRDGATGTYEKLKETFSTYFGASDKAADWLATGTEKFNGKDNGSWTLTDRIAQAMNSEFDPEAYRRINGIGTGVDAGTDYLTRGMEEGLPVNNKEAVPLLTQARTDYVNEYLKTMGFSSPKDAPPSLIAEVNNVVKNAFGDNLGAFKTALATPDSLKESIGTLKEAEFLDRTAQEFTSGERKFTPKLEFAGWNTPGSDVFKMPAGMKYASESDIAKSMAGSASLYSSYDTKGNLVYLVKDEAYVPPKVYESSTGTIAPKTTTTNGGALGAAATSKSTVGYNMFDGIKSMTSGEKLNFFANASDATLKELATIYPNAGAPTGTSTSANEKIIKTIKDGVEILRGAANQDNANLIYKIIDKGFDVAGTTLEGIAQITGGATFISGLLTGENPNSLPTMQITKTLNGIVDAVRSDDMKASIKSYSDIIQSAQGTDVIGALLSNVADNPAGAMNFIGASLVSSLPGFAAGKYLGGIAGAEAALQGFSVDAVNKMTAGVAVATSRLYEIGLEGTSNGLEAFNDFYDAYKKANPTWNEEQLTSASMSGAKLVAGSAMAVTLGTQVVGLDRLTNNLLGADTASASTFRNILDKLVTTPITEGIQEGPFQSGVPTIVKEMILKEIDPTRTVETAFGQVLGQSTLGTIAGLGAAGAIGIIQSTEDMVGSVVAANEAFTKALQSTNYTMGELGTVIDQWVPRTNLAVSPLNDVRVATIEGALVANPQFAESFSTPQAYMDAVRNEFGVFEVTKLANIAASAPKFSGEVLTSTQAVQLLQNSGKTDATIQDAVSLNLVGAVTPKTIASLPQLISTADDAKTKITNWYQEYFGRPPEAAVLNSWVNSVVKGASLENVRSLIATSDEADIKNAADITNWFQTYVGRTPTTNEVVDWSARIDTGAVTSNQVRDSILNLPEAQAYTESQATSSTSKALQEALGRNPTSEEVSYWNNLSNTQGQAAALTQISAIPYIRGTYKSVFNTEPTAEQVALWSKKLGAGEATYGNLSNLMKGSTGQTTETTTPTGYTDAQIYTLKNQILDKVDQYQAQGYTFDQAVQAAVSTIANTSNVSSSDLLSKLGTTTNALKTEFSSQFGTVDDNLADLIAKNENYGMNRETATQKAISELASQMGMSETAVKSYVDIASSQFQNEIEIAKTDLGKQLAPIQSAAPQIMTDIQKQMQDYVSAGLDPSIALDLAVSTVAQDRNITKTNLLSGLKTSVATLQQALVPTKTDVQTVAQLVGKPASQVTTADMQAVKSMVDQQIATNLLYDVNQDQKVDTTDLQLLQQQQQIQQQQNIKTVVDPNTGVKTYIDTTTNKPVTGFDVTGTQWAPTGIYEEGDTESTKKQKNQFGQLVDKLFQIPEVSQQLVKVDTPPPSHINYIYDFSSIFATPSQASLMPSPYGATNTVMPQQKQGGIMGQAANDVYGAPYKMAVGGFAEGGIVNSNDIQVGDGGSIDDLINILKGNG